MSNFLWKAARADAQIVEGHIQAASLAQAMIQLRTQGLTPLQISEAGGAVVSLALAPTEQPSGSSRFGGLFASNAITQADILVMTSELSIMLKAGLALDSALRVLIGMSAKPAMISLSQTILDDVKSGVPLSRALKRHPQQFGDFYINMIRSGEASGQLSDVLERMVEHLERLRALRESVVSATIYPAILLGVAVLSIIAMLGFVVPQFETLFKGMGDALPTPTRIIMSIGHVFTDYGLMMGLGLVVLFGLLRRWWRTPSGRQWRQTRALRLPLVGKLMLKYDLTLFARSLGTLLGNGVPLISALNIATQTVGNLKLRQALEGVVPKVKGGGKIVDAFKASGIFEPLAINLIKVGEETGRLGPMLLELARIFNRDVETGIKRGLTLLEPLLILMLGLLIATIIVSIMLGILSVNDLAV
ncbi:type II secretion system F family protein [Rhodoferax sp.]|uniref:type II secretion system F family protein n=1 Tax=Rhodoferax sp. TaxID=50421 RepID=UPI00260B8BEC|nr:type II secretion system F family protein [Rhodoferax sp.]MDD2919860.1 type II secretion system F family protein [Rhodoferax sp.]